MATKVCVTRVYTDKSGSQLLPHGDEKAASLVAGVGARVDAAELEKYGKAVKDFFVDEENYQEPERKPIVATVAPTEPAKSSVTVKRAEPEKAPPKKKK